MSVSAAAVHAGTPGRFTRTHDITATLDADTGMTLTHNVPGIVNANDEVEVTFEPLLQAPAAVAGWAVTARTATTLTLVKGVGVGSGNAGAQVRVRVRRRHGIMG